MLLLIDGQYALIRNQMKLNVRQAVWQLKTLRHITNLMFTNGHACKYVLVTWPELEQNQFLIYPVGGATLLAHAKFNINLS